MILFVDLKRTNMLQLILLPAHVSNPTRRVRLPDECGPHKLVVVAAVTLPRHNFWLVAIVGCLEGCGADGGALPYTDNLHQREALRASSLAKEHDVRRTAVTTQLYGHALADGDFMMCDDGLHTRLVRLHVRQPLSHTVPLLNVVLLAHVYLGRTDERSSLLSHAPDHAVPEAGMVSDIFHSERRDRK